MKKNMSLEQKHVCQEREEFPSQVTQKRSNAEAERHDRESGILKRGERGLCYEGERVKAFLSLRKIMDEDKKLRRIKEAIAPLISLMIP